MASCSEIGEALIQVQWEQSHNCTETLQLELCGETACCGGEKRDYDPGH